MKKIKSVVCDWPNDDAQTCDTVGQNDCVEIKLCDGQEGLILVRTTTMDVFLKPLSFRMIAEEVPE